MAIFGTAKRGFGRERRSFIRLAAMVLLAAVALPGGPLSGSESAFAQKRQKFPEGTRLDLVALMVEFQRDTNRFTSGDGTFDAGSIPYLVDPGTRIDPLPHDRGYFSSLLEFSKGYFESQAGGRITFRPHVLSKVVRLPHPMETYSPVGEDPGLAPLANMVRDAWMQVGRDRVLIEELNGMDLDPETTGFILFHAGIGRDIELTGTILEKTPQDLPSVFFDRTQLSVLLGADDFEGFEVSGTDLRVANAMIVPRTESRSGTDLTGETFVLPLSVNGMLTAQIGSFLGLPDLFDTRTGQSGIGRFGLMDGAGIFAFNGLFPPRLSAFERVWLGWDAPVVVDPAKLTADSGLTVRFAASGVQDDAEILLPTIIKIPVTRTEYFLVENRHRDPNGDGVELTFTLADGQRQSVRFTNADETFLRMDLGVDTLLPRGVLTEVSHYDFALHGGLDVGEDGEAGTADDRDLNGGILIWHIDESVIEQVMRENEILAQTGDSTARFRGLNDLPWRRAVDLEEADGAQDIGYSTSLGFSSIDPTGSAFDFWWDGNDARVITSSQVISLYRNVFDGSSTPDNRTAAGAPSWFRLDQFSESSLVASVRVQGVKSSIEGQLERLFSATIPDRFGITGGLGKNGAFDVTGFNGRNNSDPASQFAKQFQPLPRIASFSDGSSGIIIPAEDSVWFIPMDDVQGLSKVPVPGLQNPSDVVSRLQSSNGTVAVSTGGMQTPLLTNDKLVLTTLPFLEEAGGAQGEPQVIVHVFDRTDAPAFFRERFSVSLPANRTALLLDEFGYVHAPLRGWRVDPTASSAQASVVEQARASGDAELISAEIGGLQLRWDASGLTVKQTSTGNTVASFAFDPVQEVLEGRRGWIGALETEANRSGFFILNGSALYLLEEPFNQLVTLSISVGAHLPSFGDVDGNGVVDAVFVTASRGAGDGNALAKKNGGGERGGEGGGEGSGAYKRSTSLTGQMTDEIDWSGDGYKTYEIHAIGKRGAFLAGFPRALNRELADEGTFTPSTSSWQGVLAPEISPSGSVLLADVSDRQGLEIAVPLRENGSYTIRAFSSDGSLLPEWSASVGGSEAGVDTDSGLAGETSDFASYLPASGVLLASDTLLTLSPSGDVQLFRYSGHNRTVWASAIGPAPDKPVRLSLSGETSPSRDYGILNSSEVYNWPNPSFDNTFIRFETSVSCLVRIDVITPAGRRVWSKEMTSVGGAPEEVALSTQHWPSGGYIVRVQATHDGSTESKLFNMAVVR